MKTKTCKRCSETKILDEFYARRNVCKSCVHVQHHQYRLAHAEECRAYEKSRLHNPNRKLARKKNRCTAEQKRKDLVRQKAQWAIKTGRLIPQPCRVCGEVKVEAHHRDYSKPFEVEWLCSLHHRRLHHSKYFDLGVGLASPSGG